VIALALVLLPAAIWAHPHIFFDVHLEVDLGPDKHLVLKYVLYADHTTCVAMLCEGDENSDGTMTEEEMAYLHELYSEYFARFRHFVRVDLGDEIAEADVDDFRILERRDKPRHFLITYTAKVDINEPVEGQERRMEIELFDQTGYAAFTQVIKKTRVVPRERRVEVREVSLLPTHAGIGVKYIVSKPPPPPPPPEPGAEAEASSAPEAAAPVAVGVTEVAEASLYVRFKKALLTGRRKIEEMIRRLSTDFSLGLFLTLVGFSLLYGVFHALGPGHGKALVAAFMMRGSSRPWHAVVLSVVVTFSHTGVSVLLIVMMKWVLEGIFSYKGGKGQVEGIVGVLSGGLVLLIGIILIVQMFRDAKRQVSEEAVTVAQVTRWGLAVGLVPCPASMLIMLVSSSVGLLWVGLFLTASLAVGLSLVLLAVALATVYAKKGATSLASRKAGLGAKLQFGVAVGGNLLVIGLGIFVIWYHWANFL
jgi:ABC-type nickel/cobalt efflux system permease component RcnA/ABC-type uncharacterized transport system substrate-binding protein